MTPEELAAALARDLRPVRRPARPAAALLGWLGAAGLAVAVAAWVHGSASPPGLPPEAALAALTAVLAALAALHAAVPGQDARWAWLPLPAALAWLGSMAVAGVAEGAAPGISRSCISFIAALGLPAAAALLWLARHAGGWRPGAVAALGGLAGAALAAAGLACVHGPMAAATVLLSHGGAVAGVALLAALLGPALLRRPA